MKNNIIRVIILFIGFTSIVGFLTIFSLLKSINIFETKYKECTWNNLKVINKEVEEEYKKAIVLRNTFIDLYGITHRVSGKSIIGNFEFIKDSDGMMHQIMEQSGLAEFSENLVALNECLSEKSIPLIYIQVPSRENDSTFPFQSKYVNNTLDLVRILQPFLTQNNIASVDVDAYLKREDFLSNEFFFKTDIHLTTEGEFALLDVLAQYLNDNYGIRIENLEKILNEKNYFKHSYSFSGNLVKSVGKYYMDEDIFNVYIPDFETNMSLAIDTQVVRSGVFDQVVMNNYEKSFDNNPYWVTNYLQYGVPYYQIENHMVDGPKLLFVMDSMCMRTVSYLSLGCSDITVMDPRFFNGKSYLDEILTEQYDAVIVCHQTSLFFKLFEDLE